MLEITNDTKYFNSDNVEPLYLTKVEFKNEKQLENYIKTIIRVVRGSFEYKNLISYIKSELEFNDCAVWNGLDSSKVEIQLHHECLTIFDITEIVLEKFIRNSQPIVTTIIATEVIHLHYIGLVALVPLSSTAHEMVHSNLIEVSKDQVIGDVNKFFKAYQPYFNESQITKYKLFNETSGGSTVKIELFTEDKFKEDIDKKKLFNDSISNIEICLQQSKELV